MSTLPKVTPTTSLVDPSNKVDELALVPSAKPIITEERFREGMKTGFKLEELAHMSEAQQDELASHMVNSARDQWNSDRTAEIVNSKSLEAKDVQEAMATDIFNATISYLNTIPKDVKKRVLDKFRLYLVQNKVIKLSR